MAASALRSAWRLALMLVLLGVLVLSSLLLGPVALESGEVLAALLPGGAHPDERTAAILYQIRLPRTLAALLAGAGLALAGALMQTVLRNPLGSPFTLGIAQAAALGAALMIMFAPDGLRTVPGLALGAFVMACLGALVIMGLARLRQSTPQTIILAGVALGALFQAASMLLQYFADDLELASMLFWSFGDLSRAAWVELGSMALALLVAILWALRQRWALSALEAGPETAASLGVRVGRLRLASMLLASLLSAVVVAALGIIGFVGLIAPHLVRSLLGNDMLQILLGSLLLGALLMLGADLAARELLAPRSLPVSILTAFLGAPGFLILLMRRS